MQDKVLKMALIGVGNMGKKYAQMIVSGEVLHMKLADSMGKNTCKC